MRVATAFVTERQRAGKFPQLALLTAVATQAVGMLGLYSVGTHSVTAVMFLILMGGELGPVFMVAQNEMLYGAPGRTDIALAADSGAYNLALRLAPHSGHRSYRLPGCEAPSSPAGC